MSSSQYQSVQHVTHKHTYTHTWTHVQPSARSNLSAPPFTILSLWNSAISYWGRGKGQFPFKTTLFQAQRSYTEFSLLYAKLFYLCRAAQFLRGLFEEACKWRVYKMFGRIAIQGKQRILLERRNCISPRFKFRVAS